MSGASLAHQVLRVQSRRGRATNVGVQATVAAGVSNGASSGRNWRCCAVGGWIALVWREMRYLARRCGWPWGMILTLLMEMQRPTAGRLPDGLDDGMGKIQWVRAVGCDK